MRTEKYHLEAKIRDWLAANLNFISDDLQLVQKEYHLRNAFGSAGYIDILAKDRYKNSVIIEIKRSDVAARQAIHEVFKYASLLKQNFRIKESELRVIIISTEWHELLVPYSEFCRDTRYTVEAYQIDLDENNIPIRKEPVRPLEKRAERNISPKHLVYFYRKMEDMHRNAEAIRKKMKEIGIPDFVVLACVKPEPRGNVIYPYGAYLVFQRYDIDFYCSILGKETGFLEELEAVKDSAASDDEFLNDLEDCVLNQLTVNFFDDVETSYPEKLITQIEEYNWQVEVILKEGLFATDPRLDNKMVLNEILGFTGSSATYYSNYSHSNMKARIKEIEQNATEHLGSEHRWLSHIQLAFSELEQNPEEYDLTLEIYNPPESILFTLHKFHNRHKFDIVDPILLIPNYVLKVDLFDHKGTSLLQIGRISWDGRKRSFDALQRHVFGGNASWYVTADLFNPATRRESEILQFLGLKYVSDVFTMRNGHMEKVCTIEECRDYTHLDKQLYLEDYDVKSRDFLDDLETIYGGYIMM